MRDKQSESKYIRICVDWYDLGINMYCSSWSTAAVDSEYVFRFLQFFLGEQTLYVCHACNCLFACHVHVSLCLSCTCIPMPVMYMYPLPVMYMYPLPVMYMYPYACHVHESLCLSCTCIPMPVMYMYPLPVMYIYPYACHVHVSLCLSCTCIHTCLIPVMQVFPMLIKVVCTSHTSQSWC